MGLLILPMVLVMLYLHTNVDASCGFDNLKHEITEYGTHVSYCEYKGLKLLEPSKFIDKEDCVEVTCLASGLSICGVGINAGVFSSPRGCKLVNDGCEPRRIQDPTKRQRCRFVD